MAIYTKDNLHLLQRNLQTNDVIIFQVGEEILEYEVSSNATYLSIKDGGLGNDAIFTKLGIRNAHSFARTYYSNSPRSGTCFPESAAPDLRGRLLDLEKIIYGLFAKCAKFNDETILLTDEDRLQEQKISLTRDSGQSASRIECPSRSFAVEFRPISYKACYVRSRKRASRS
jgi:hypothetical protein